MPAPAASAVETFTQSDGYVSHYRIWGPSTGRDVIVVLHGGMSHSSWQQPLGEALVPDSGITFVALDRRGSGLNAQPGHLEKGAQAIEDAAEFLRHLKTSFERVHLAGWCFGGQVATSVAAGVADENVISSLLLLAPGFHFNERYSDVLRLSLEAVFAAVTDLGLEPSADTPFIKVPLEPGDFTTDPDWHRFIESDELRLTRVAPSMTDAWSELAELAAKDFADIPDVPVLAVLAKADRLVDNARVRAFLETRDGIRFEELNTGHALHFEEPAKLAGIVKSFIQTV
ncbi:alpha/beta fold hydrolase [Streptomyces sp. NPDC056061]|uniref:alpha/beta fold hydrolase n=1 Tax=Streptomyces sp. NPDC056061 TaxID=3345700 RepID=UPI0035DC23EC